MIIHPSFASDIYTNDIAIIKLKGSVEITDYVKPVCLWDGPNKLSDIVSKEGS